MALVVVPEKISPIGLDSLRDQGHEVLELLDVSREELKAALQDAHALIVRSATQVDAELLEAAPNLKIVGRAGIGLDNVDVQAATAKGVIVANAPNSNAVSAAEHTMALLLAQARNVVAGHISLHEGRWDRNKLKGVELSEKTLGIIGFGRIGRLVAERARAFGMKIVVCDPFVDSESVKEHHAELVELEELMSRSDFVTLHLAKTPETLGLLGQDVLSKAKPGMRIVNVARGGIIDEQALHDQILNGPIAGAAIDVFAKEPLLASPLFELDQITVTPHLGASTGEAQLKAGVMIAEQVAFALAAKPVPNAVNSITS